MQTVANQQAAPQIEGTSFEVLSRSLAGKAALVVSASLFVALCAHFTVPLPFTPVPLTLVRSGCC